jgi:hypothetical protein
MQDHTLTLHSIPAPAVTRFQRLRSIVSAWFAAWCWQAERPGRRVPYY